MRSRAVSLGVAGVAVAALALAACSSGSTARGGGASGTGSSAAAVAGNSGASGTDSSAAAATPAIPYTGPEKNLPRIKVPTVKAGTKCKIGYQTIIGSVPAQKAEADAAGVEAKRLGCSYISLDDQNSPTTQVNNFNQLVAQRVSAIIVFPMVASALTPSLKKAKAAGVYVLGQSAPIKADAPPIAGYATNALHMSDYEAYLRVRSVAAAKPGAKFVEMGLAAPIELLQYYAERTKYWAKKFGLEYLGEIDATQDNPNGYSAATSAIVGKYPSMQALFTFSDNSAVGAAAVLHSSGDSGVLISGGDGSQNAIDAIKAGRVFNSPQPDFLSTAKQLVDAAYDLITNQNLPLPASFGSSVTLVDKSNADSVKGIG